MKLVCLLNDPHRFSKLHFFTPNKSYHFVNNDTSSGVMIINDKNKEIYLMNWQLNNYFLPLEEYRSIQLERLDIF
jgi:hypothetical protein